MTSHIALRVEANRVHARRDTTRCVRRLIAELRARFYIAKKNNKLNLHSAECASHFDIEFRVRRSHLDQPFRDEAPCVAEVIFDSFEIGSRGLRSSPCRSLCKREKRSC
jgi:hypothetical protein